jgi:hypothetical protein
MKTKRNFILIVNILVFSIGLYAQVGDRQLVGCGVSKDEYNNLVSENQKLKETVSQLENELDLYKNSEPRLFAIIDQGVKSGDISSAKENIVLFEKYHPESMNKPEIKQIITAIEEEEARIAQIAAEEEAAEKAAALKRQKGMSLDNPIIIDGEGQNFDIILKDLMFDRKRYDGKFISIQNTYFDQFGVNSSNFALGFGYLEDWCNDPDTYEIGSQYGSTLYSTMEANNIYLLFHPSEQDIRARRFMIEIKGKYNTNRSRRFLFHVTGKFSIVGNVQKHVLTISQFTYDGDSYNGVLP